MRTDTATIEQASAAILAYGSPRDRELRAYYHARGRFADIITLAASLAPAPARLSLVA